MSVNRFCVKVCYHNYATKSLSYLILGLLWALKMMHLFEEDENDDCDCEDCEDCEDEEW